MASIRIYDYSCDYLETILIKNLFVFYCPYIIVTYYYLRKNDVHDYWFSSYLSSGVKKKNESIIFIVMKYSSFKGYFIWDTWIFGIREKGTKRIVYHLVK